jgi:LmbE family N-acetylglucosaminyl deacetylase
MQNILFLRLLSLVMMSAGGFAIFVIAATFTTSIRAQPTPPMNAAQLKLALNKLTVLGSVMYVAAHPDDENTALISYCANEKLLRTAYLSMTRGDGGQNLIGSEMSELLGVIRTQELLAARRADGGEQLFTRAVDFGFSKGPNETLTIWGKERVLADVVWAIRKFRPDVILTRFPKTGEGGHGHHTASAILAEEAFAAAADPKRFPEQLQYVKVWQAKRILWNAWLPVLEARKADLATLTSVDVGAYNVLLGKSYTELAAESRSMHKSQGFGSSGVRGETLNYFDFLAGDSLKTVDGKYDIFGGTDLTWSRVQGGAAVGKLLEEAKSRFNPENPAALLPTLLQAYREMSLLKDDYWIPQKRKELSEVIRSCAGMWVESVALKPNTQNEPEYSGVAGGLVKISAAVVNRSNAPVMLKRVLFPFSGDSLVNKELQKGKFLTTVVTKTIPKNTPLTQPYWLQTAPDKGLFSVSDQQMIGLPENPPALAVTFVLGFGAGGGTELSFTTPLLSRRTDPVLGEVYRPFELVPPVALNLADKSLVFADATAREIPVVVKSNIQNAQGSVSLNLPVGWKCEPRNIAFTLAGKHDEMKAIFKITPPAKPNSASSDEFVLAQATLNPTLNDAVGNATTTSKGMMSIAYTHIPTQTLFPEAKAKLVYLNVQKTIKTIGYIASASDDVPDYLAQLGFDVKLLTDDDVDNQPLARFDAIVTGVRAYNTRPRLKQQYRRLMDYVSSGGTLLVQYNTSNALVTDSIGPYPFTISRDRVTEEDAAITIANSKHPLLMQPNVISAQDFDGWVQERGLYFASKWDARYQTLLSCHDTGESDKSGGMLVAQYGKGVFIYSGYAWFRQLPAGVPGAYRLLVNLLHAAKTLDNAK